MYIVEYAYTRMRYHATFEREPSSIPPPTVSVTILSYFLTTRHAKSLLGDDKTASFKEQKNVKSTKKPE